jgi:hypothetical protein
MARPDRYRLRAPASGREAIVTLNGNEDEEGVAFYDQVTGERMEIVGKLLPLSGSGSKLPRAPENMRVCNHCGELVGMDVSECPVCHRRIQALGDGGA